MFKNFFERFKKLPDKESQNQKEIQNKSHIQEDQIEGEKSAEFYNFDLTKIKFNIRNCDSSEITASHEKYFLGYISGKPITLPNIARYWTYDYNMDFNDVIQRFVSGGYIEIKFDLDLELGNRTIPEIKEILKSKSLKVDGKKADLIERLRLNFTEEEILSKFENLQKRFVATEKGAKIVNDYKNGLISRDYDYEKSVFDRILDNDINGAFKLISAYEMKRRFPRGIGVNWSSIHKNGISEKEENNYKAMLSGSGESDEIHKIKAASVLVKMLGLSYNDTQRVLNNISGIESDATKANNTIDLVRQSYAIENLDSYLSIGIEKYRILGCLDDRTCAECGVLDGKVFKSSDAVMGKNYPPFHSGCRCTTVAVFDDEDLSQRQRSARNPETRKTYYVSADTTWAEWIKENMKK